MKDIVSGLQLLDVSTQSSLSQGSPTLSDHVFSTPEASERTPIVTQTNIVGVIDESESPWRVFLCLLLRRGGNRYQFFRTKHFQRTIFSELFKVFDTFFLPWEFENLDCPSQRVEVAIDLRCSLGALSHCCVHEEKLVFDQVKLALFTRGHVKRTHLKSSLVLIL